MEFIKKLFNKKEYNNKNNMAQIDKGTIFVWQRSERAGKIAVADKIDGQWLMFEDGSRINKELIGEYLERVESHEQALEMSKIHLGGNVPNNQTQSSPTPVVTIKEESKENNTQNIESIDVNNIMVNILERLSKKNKTNLEISVGIHLPSKTILKALQQDVDDEELKTGLELLIKKQINNIEDQLNKQVKSFIQNYYYEQTRKKKSS